jgi:hypothetical protein
MLGSDLMLQAGIEILFVANFANSILEGLNG